MTNPHEPVTPNPDGTLRFSDGSQLKVEPGDRPKCPWCGDVGCELHDAGEAWRLGHDNNCNVRLGFPSTEEDCNCHSPAAPNEIERQMNKEKPITNEPICTCPPEQLMHSADCPMQQRSGRKVWPSNPGDYAAWIKSQFGLKDDPSPEPNGLPEYLEDLKAKLAAERRKVQHLQDTVRSIELPESKPPRIRTLELPGEINPDTHELSVQFAIVLDRMGDTTVDDNQLDRLADETGARTAVSFPFEIQIGED